MTVDVEVSQNDSFLLDMKKPNTILNERDYTIDSQPKLETPHPAAQFRDSRLLLHTYGPRKIYE